MSVERGKMPEAKIFLPNSWQKQESSRKMKVIVNSVVKNSCINYSHKEKSVLINCSMSWAHFNGENKKSRKQTPKCCI